MIVARQNGSTRTAWALGLMIGLVFLAAGCQAPLEQKKGLSGDFCNGSDKHCKSPFLCLDGVCQSLNDAPEMCRDICAKYQQCNAGVSKCYGNCTETLKTWSKEKTQEYRDCNVNLSCSKIQGSKAPQNICYGRLELAQVRLDRCKTLRDTAERCFREADNFSKYESNVNTFFDKCRRKGRTAADQRWKPTEQCEEWATADSTQCGKMFACINSNFPLDEEFPTSRPGQ